MKNDVWFKSWFSSPEYLKLYEHRNTHDAKLLIDLLFKNIKLKPKSRILDLACGNGRHSILFAAKGFDTLGIDLSEFLIKQAKKQLSGEYIRYKNNIKFEIRDMRELNHKNEFDLVVNLFSSFGYFASQKDNEKVIKGISIALKQDGYFLFDFLNNTYLRNNLVPFDIKKSAGESAIQIRSIHHGFVTKEIYILSQRKPGHYYPKILHFTERIRLYSLEDFQRMFKDYNLRIIKALGDYNGSKFNEKSSKRLIIIAKKL